MIRSRPSWPTSNAASTMQMVASTREKPRQSASRLWIRSFCSTRGSRAGPLFLISMEPQLSPAAGWCQRLTTRYPQLIVHQQSARWMHHAGRAEVAAVPLTVDDLQDSALARMAESRQRVGQGARRVNASTEP